ncbi:MAG: hypothetical protein ACQERZ_01545 [Fusobacteriota bacterium]
MKEIGYFKVILQDEKYIGGIMVADIDGIPIEFKYTDPIEPTKLQQVLYGAVLGKYIREEVIIKNLIKQIENKPEIFITDSQENIGLSKVIKKDLLVIKKTKMKPFKEKKDYKKIKENEILFQMNEEDSPIRILLNKEEEKTVEMLTKIDENIDFIEPLDRMEEALRLICKGEL